MEKGHRYQTVELSAIDTALMMAGVLFAQSYFDRDDPAEREIRDLADKLYRRVEWSWMQPRPPLIAMAWRPESGMHTHDYKGYEEAMILYVLALGSPTHAISPDAWKARIANYKWDDVLRPGVHQLRAALHPPVLAHLDRLPRHPRRLHARKGRRLLRELAARHLRAARVCRGESRTFRGYGENMWGLTASHRADATPRGPSTDGRSSSTPTGRAAPARRHPRRRDHRADGRGRVAAVRAGDRAAGAEGDAGAARRARRSSATASSTRSTPRSRRQA